MVSIHLLTQQRANYWHHILLPESCVLFTFLKNFLDHISWVLCWADLCRELIISSQPSEAYTMKVERRSIWGAKLLFLGEKTRAKIPYLCITKDSSGPDVFFKYYLSNHSTERAEISAWAQAVPTVRGRWVPISLVIRRKTGWQEPGCTWTWLLLKEEAEPSAVKFSGGGSGKGRERDSVCLLPLLPPEDKFRSPTEVWREAQATNGRRCYFRAWGTEGDTELGEGTAPNSSGMGRRPQSLCHRGTDTAWGQWMWSVWWMWPGGRVTREVSRPGGDGQQVEVSHESGGRAMEDLVLSRK